MKKILCMLLCAVLLLSGIPAVAALEDQNPQNIAAANGYELLDNDSDVIGDNYYLGDVNSDNLLSSSDILAMRLYMAGNPSVTISETASNINGDAAGVNAADLLTLRLHIAGELNIGETYGYPGFKVGKITLGGVNISEFDLVVPSDSDSEDVLHYSAEMLCLYIREACGVKLNIVNGTSRAQHYISFAFDTTDTLGDEGYTYRATADGNIEIIGGTQRGTLYAVYDFLEEYIGYRFLSGSVTYIYDAAEIALPTDLDITEIPVFEERAVSANGYGSRNAERYGFPQKVNSKQNFYGFDFTRFGRLHGRHYLNAHSFYYYYFGGATPESEQWATEHQPCYSDDEIYETMFNNMLEMVEMVKGWNQVLEVENSHVSFSINDNTESRGYCQCVWCRNLRITYKGFAGSTIWFVNKAADDFQEYYPGIKLFTILYDHKPPVDELGNFVITPNDNVVLMYCGTGCNNHTISGGGCGDNLTNLLGSNTLDCEWIQQWKSVTENMYFWYYMTNFHYYLAPSPNLMNLREDVKFLADIGVKGMYMEGSGATLYTFESLRNYLAAKLEWDPYMSQDEYISLMQEYLRLMYGDGWEELYQYILMMDTCSKLNTCYINNNNRPWRMYNEAYYAEHFEEILELFDAAYRKADTAAQKMLIRRMELHADFLGLSATYESNYVNGTPDQRSLYEQRYSAFYNYLKTNNITIFSSDQYTIPATCNLVTSPMEQFYQDGYN